MKEKILYAVAMPARLFWAPFKPAIFNLGLQLACMCILMSIYSINPLWVVATVAVGHISLIVAGVKEPHLSQMMTSQGKMMKSYKTIYPENGRKLSS